MTIAKPHLMTKLPVWAPRYSDLHTSGERVALLHKTKVDFGSPVILVEFTRAKHLAGQRFCIRKQDAQRCAVGSNGTAPMYVVPMNRFESWDTPQEIRDIAISLFEN